MSSTCEQVEGDACRTDRRGTSDRARGARQARRPSASGACRDRPAARLLVGSSVERLLGERRRLLEAVVARRLLPGEAVDLAVGWVDRERPSRLRRRSRLCRPSRTPSPRASRAPRGCDGLNARTLSISARASASRSASRCRAASSKCASARSGSISIARAAAVGRLRRIVVLQHAREAGVRRRPLRRRPAAPPETTSALRAGCTCRGTGGPTRFRSIAGSPPARSASR